MPSNTFPFSEFLPELSEFTLARRCVFYVGAGAVRKYTCVAGGAGARIKHID